jgi:hypothetical protein
MTHSLILIGEIRMHTEIRGDVLCGADLTDGAITMDIEMDFMMDIIQPYIMVIIYPTII